MNAATHALRRVSQAYTTGCLKLAIVGMLALTSIPSFADVTPFDPTKDQSGGKTAIDIANNTGNTAQVGAGLALLLFGIGGFMIVGWSVWGLWKASKDESGREGQGKYWYGMLIGGLMSGISVIVWVVHNSLFGTGTA